MNLDGVSVRESNPPMRVNCVQGVPTAARMAGSETLSIRMACGAGIATEQRPWSRSVLRIMGFSLSLRPGLVKNKEAYDSFCTRAFSVTDDTNLRRPQRTPRGLGNVWDHNRVSVPVRLPGVEGGFSP